MSAHRLNRLLGVAVAELWLTVFNVFLGRQESNTHPEGYDRLFQVLDQYVDRGDDEEYHLKFQQEAEYEIEIAFQYEREKWLPDWERSTERDVKYTRAKPTTLLGDRKLWFVQLFTPYITAQ